MYSLISAIAERHKGAALIVTVSILWCRHQQPNLPAHQVCPFLPALHKMDICPLIVHVPVRDSAPLYSLCLSLEGGFMLLRNCAKGGARLGVEAKHCMKRVERMDVIPPANPYLAAPYYWYLLIRHRIEFKLMWMHPFWLLIWVCCAFNATTSDF